MKQWFEDTEYQPIKESDYRNADNTNSTFGPPLCAPLWTTDGATLDNYPGVSLPCPSLYKSWELNLERGGEYLHSTLNQPQVPTCPVSRLLWMKLCINDMQCLALFSVCFVFKCLLILEDALLTLFQLPTVISRGSVEWFLWEKKRTKTKAYQSQIAQNQWYKKILKASREKRHDICRMWKVEQQPPKDVHVVILGIYKYVRSHSKRN